MKWEEDKCTISRTEEPLNGKLVVKVACNCEEPGEVMVFQSLWNKTPDTNAGLVKVDKENFLGFDYFASLITYCILALILIWFCFGRFGFR